MIKVMTTKKIIFDSKNLPCDISEVEWVLKSDYDALTQLSDAFYLKQVQLENQNEELKYQLAGRSEKYKIAMDKGVDVLSAEIKALKAKLEKAEAVISFYADENNWKTMEHCESDTISRIRVQAQDYDSFGVSRYGEASKLILIGGKQAREYLKGEG